MARPIESTPTLSGKKAKRFMEKINRPTSDAEKKSLEHARKVYEEIEFIN